MQPWALVTPASRGIGLELARRLLQTTKVPIVATARQDVDQTREKVLDGLEDVDEGRLNVLKVDVLDEQSIKSAATQIKELYPPKSAYLKLALCIPGVLFPEKSPAQIDQSNALLTFQTNVLGPLLMMKHMSQFLPRKAADTRAESPGLPEHAVWANMSARVGSISDNRLGGWYSYRASKAALNQATRTFDHWLRASAGEKAMAITLHPGTVKTGLSKEFWDNVRADKLFSPEFAADKLLEVVKSRQQSDRGKCWDWKGDEVPP